MQNWKSKHPLVLTLIFAVVAYSWSALCWRPILGDIKPNLFGMAPHALALMLLGGLGPTAAAIIVSLITGGPREVVALLTRTVRWRVSGLWYLLAFLFPLVAVGGGVAIYAALGHDAGPVRWDHWWIIAAFYGVAIFLGPLLEETGWRGFAQPVLFNRYGIFVTGVIVGTLWTFWHTPLWFAAEGSSLSGGGLTPVSLGCYWLFLVGQSVFAAWLLSKARGSVPVAMIVHQGMNAGAMGWLFYDIPAADKPWVFEQLPVIAIWAVIGLGLVFGAMRGRVKTQD
jgi:membrane protease YdiL (CAAX protease family)